MNCEDATEGKAVEDLCHCHLNLIIHLVAQRDLETLFEYIFHCKS